MRFWRIRSVYKMNHKIRRPLRETETGRASFPASYLAGSMTLEAALVLPFFLFFMMEILYLFDGIRLQSSMIAALHETGTQISEYAFYAKYGIEGKEFLPEKGMTGTLESLAVSETYVRKSVSDFLGDEYLKHSCLENGKGGISYLRSSILTEDGIVDITADYRIRPFLPLFGLKSLPVQSRYYGHAWTGYEIGSGNDTCGQEGEEEEETVYVTSAGVVYHRNRNCTYLKPSIRKIDASLVDAARSRDGSRYYACESCKPEKTGTLIITTDGNRYHSSASCSAIRREIQEISESEAKKTRRPCSKCGG